MHRLQVYPLNETEYLIVGIPNRNAVNHAVKETKTHLQKQRVGRLRKNLSILLLAESLRTVLLMKANFRIKNGVVMFESSEKY